MEARILTYNVLHNRNLFELRAAALFRTIAESNADIIGFQEVTPWFLDALQAEPWMDSYNIALAVDPRGNSYIHRELLIVTRFPVRWVKTSDLPSNPDEPHALLWASVRLADDMELIVANTHLESRLKYGVLRAKQLDLIFETLQDFDQVLLLGDFNFGDGEEPESSHLSVEYADLWSSIYPDNCGYTWNIEKSEMARKGSYVGEGSRRLDRLLLRSGHLRGSAVRIIGDAPISKEHAQVFPTDHFGVVGTIRN